MARRRHTEPEYANWQPPRELCGRCHEWVSAEEIREGRMDDFPHCVDGWDYDCQRYMDGRCDNCPRFNEW